MDLLQQLFASLELLLDLCLERRDICLYMEHAATTLAASTHGLEQLRSR